MKILFILITLLQASSSLAVRLTPRGNDTFTLQQTTALTTIKVTAHGQSLLADFFKKVSPDNKSFSTESLSQDFSAECARLTSRGPVCKFTYSHSANSVYQVGALNSRIILPVHSVPGLERAAPTQMILADKYGNLFILKIDATKIELGLNLN